jgi:predicted transcriptional regulator of viral defense system
MTTHALRDVFITTIKRKKEKKLGDITYHFICSKKEHFWGETAHWATRQEQVLVSDPERPLRRCDGCGARNMDRAKEPGSRKA